MKEPLVYIVLVNYNGYKDTIECIESLKNIEYKNYKIIVVDNASSDESIDILSKQYNDIKLIKSKENLGFSGGNNLGIKEAVDKKAEFILLLNNDTTVEPNFLNNIVFKSIEDKNVGMAIGKILYYKEKNKIWYGGGEIVDKKGDSIHIGFNEDKDYIKSNEIRYVSFATGCYMLIKVDAIKRIGIMPEEYFLYYEDTDYSMKFNQENLKILYYPDSVIYHKVSSSTGNMSSLSQYYYARNRLIFINQNIKVGNKIFAYTNFYIDIMKNIIRRRGKLKNYFNGCRDFYKGIYGNSFSMNN